MDVKEVLLPGVGLRYEFDIEDGERIGVIARRSGDFELVVYTGDDPDQAQPVLRLTDEEAEALALILGAPRMAERFADLTREVPGLNAGQVEIGRTARSSTDHSVKLARAPAPARRSWRSCAQTKCWRRLDRRKPCALATCWW